MPPRRRTTVPFAPPSACGSAGSAPSPAPAAVAVVAAALHAPDPSTLKLNWRVRNGSFTRLTFGGGRLSLDTFNEQAHLPGDLGSWR